MNLRIILAALLTGLAPGVAFACPSPLQGNDANGTKQNFGVTLDGSLNCYGNIAIVDGSNAANKATVTSGNALKVDGSAVTQPVSGTVTATQGSPPWSVSQSGNWTARVVGNAGGVFDFAGQNAAQPANSILIGGEFNTTPTTLTSGNASPLQLDSAGNLLVNIKANSFGALTISGTVTSNQGTSPWVENVSQFGGSAVVTGTGAGGSGIPRVTVSNDSNVLATQSGTWTVQQGGAPWSVSQSGTWTVQQGTPPWTIQGDSASGTSNAGNPVKAGGVFNTTQPTVTTGQTVDAQSTARGALIVATGVDAFTVGGTVTANAGSGTFTVSGTVTANQGTTPWTDNITQFGGTNISTGTGASGAGIPRVTVSNDSNILATQSGTWTVQQGTPPWSVSQSGVWTTRIVGNAGGILDAAGQNASAPANELLTACQFNTSPTTVTSGNVTPVQCNNAGALNVAIVSGGGSGGTASSFGAAFPATGTAIGVKNGSNMVNLVADGSGNLDVNCVVGCGASGFQDLQSFTIGTSNVNITAGVYETTPAPVAAGQGAAALITGNRALNVARYDSAGRELGGALPGRNNVGEVVSLQPSLTYSPQTLFQPFDALGRANTSTMLTDGKNYVGIAPPNTAPTASQAALVVTLSPSSPSSGTGANVNVAQFGGTNVVTGTGASGSGIPRVTVSNDSNILATQSGTWTVTGTGTFAVQAAQSGTWTVQDNITQLNGVALGSPSNYGTSPGAVSVIGVNSFVTNTVTVSGTVTANAGTGTFTENLAQVNGSTVSTAATGVQKVGITGNTGAALDAAGQNASSPANEILTACQFNTSPTTVTSGNISPLQCDSGAKLLVDTGTVTVTGTVTANAGTGTFATNVAQFGGTNVVTGTGASGAGIPRVTVSNDSNILATQSGTWTVQQGSPPWTVQGDSASGASNAGNPVKVGGVFNTTQPTVTTGQTVDAQATARGALIVATGVDSFTVGGAVTANAGTGTFTVSGTVAATQSGTWTVQPGNTQNTTPWLTSIVGGGNTASVNASNQLAVNCANCSGSGVSQQDATGFTYGSGNMVPVGGVYSTAASPLASGTAGVAQLTANRALQVDRYDSNGLEVGARSVARYSPALQVNQAINLSIPNASVLSNTDAYGNPLRGSIITDGTDYADVVASNKTVGQLNGALVVVQSPRISLQCPFVQAINQTASAQIVTNGGGKSLHICGWGFISGTAQSVSLVEGTGTTCGTNTIGLVGGTSASVAAAANGGMWNMTDRITIPMQRPGDNLCVLQSSTGNVSGTLTYGVF